MNLDDNWECPGRALISGPVQVVKYILYNVSGSQVDIYSFDENGLMTSWREALGSAVAPDGNRIESTGVYSEISYWVEGLLGIHVEAWKGKLVDVVAQDEAGEKEGSDMDKNETERGRRQTGGNLTEEEEEKEAGTGTRETEYEYEERHRNQEG